MTTKDIVQTERSSVPHSPSHCDIPFSHCLATTHILLHQGGEERAHLHSLSGQMCRDGRLPTPTSTTSTSSNVPAVCQVVGLEGQLVFVQLDIQAPHSCTRLSKLELSLPQLPVARILLPLPPAYIG